MPKFDNIAVSLIDPNPDQPRLEKGDLSSLTASIKEIGVVEPVVVVATGDRYMLLAGHRRVEASVAAGLKRIPAIVSDETNGRAQFAALMAENTVRRDLTAVEEAAGIQTMLNVGWKEPGAAIGRDKEHVARAVKVAALPAALSAKLQQATLEEAEAFAEFADDKKAVKALTAALGKGDFAWTVRNTREAKAKRENIAARKAQLEAEGCPVVQTAYDGKQKRLSMLGIAAEDHRSCPGHAAIMERYGDCPIVYVCTDAPGNGHATATSAEDAKNEADRAKKRKEQAKRAEEWETAAAVRLEFVRKLLHGKLPSGVMPWAFSELIEAMRKGDWDIEEHYTAIWGSAAGLATEKHAPGMIAAIAACGIEGELEQTFTYAYARAPRRTKTYLELLMTEGYALSPVERAHYDACVADLAKKPKSGACDQDCDNCENQCEAAS